MEKVYNLSDESEIFQNFTIIYTTIVSGRTNYRLFLTVDDEIDYCDLMKLCKHHAECGEMVYIIGLNENINNEIPKNLVILDCFTKLKKMEFAKHALVIRLDCISDINIYSYLDESIDNYAMFTFTNVKTTNDE